MGSLARPVAHGPVELSCSTEKALMGRTLEASDIIILSASLCRGIERASMHLHMSPWRIVYIPDK